jgi:sugar phosphate isomerase/epimerase
MKLGISFHCYPGLDDETQIELMKKNGFEATFLASEDERIDEIVPKLREAGILLENLHGPLSDERCNANDIWRDNDRAPVLLDRLMDGVEKCGKYGVKTLVLHVTAGATPPRPNKRGYERFVQIFERARALGVEIACENIRPFGNLAFVLEQFPDSGFCWDVGHEHCSGDKRQFMPMFGCQTKALHIHDNFIDGDHHMIPYDGKIDFDRVARQIAESPYEGSVMLELIQTAHPMYAEMSPEDYYARAGAAAKRLEAQIAHYRSSGI